MPREGAAGAGEAGRESAFTFDRADYKTLNKISSESWFVLGYDGCARRGRGKSCCTSCTGWQTGTKREAGVYVYSNLSYITFSY